MCPPPAAGRTYLAFTIGMDGVGSTGTNNNPVPLAGWEKIPVMHKTRTIAVQVWDSNNNEVVKDQSAKVEYDPSNGYFIMNNFDLGTNFIGGSYIIKVKSEGHLRRATKGLVGITAGKVNTVPKLNLVAGDLNGDNIIDIRDYNILVSCYGKDVLPISCGASEKQLSDLDDNGSVNQFDYNLFLREYSVQNGDFGPTPNSTTAPTAMPLTMPQALCPISLQSKIDSGATGSILDLTNCSYNENVTISKALTLKGVKLKVPANSRGITINASNVTIDGVQITGSQATSYNGNEDGIFAYGSNSSPINNLTIKNCDIGFFGNDGIDISQAVNTNIDNCSVHDIVYAGILMISNNGGNISRNTIKRIGVSGASANGNNAYGIALSAIANGIDTQTHDINITGNLVDTVPTWHGIDTHGGYNLNFSNNTVNQACGAIFITKNGASSNSTGPVIASHDITIKGNSLNNPPASGCSTKAPIFIWGLNTGQITNNTGTGWRENSFTPPGYRDYGAPSSPVTNVTASGNTIN